MEMCGDQAQGAAFCFVSSNSWSCSCRTTPFCLLSSGSCTWTGPTISINIEVLHQQNLAFLPFSLPPVPAHSLSHVHPSSPQGPPSPPFAACPPQSMLVASKATKTPRTAWSPWQGRGQERNREEGLWLPSTGGLGPEGRSGSGMRPGWGFGCPLHCITLGSPFPLWG